MLFVGMLGLFVAALSMVMGAYLFVCRFNTQYASVRWAGTVTLATLGACFVFQTTLLLGMFSAPVVFGALMGCSLPLLALGRDPTHRTVCLAHLRDDFQHLSLPWYLLPVVGLIAFHALRNSLAPPLAWDDLTYHLVRAAFWCQDGHANGAYDAPAAWEYYRYFPLMGEAPQSLGMLFTRSDLLVSVIGLSIWLGAALGGFSIARQLGANNRVAWILTLAAVTFPAITGHVFTAYVDNFVSMLQILAVALLLHGSSEEHSKWLWLSLTAIVLSVVVKPTAALFGGAVLLAILLRAWKHGAMKGIVVWGAVLGVALVLPQAMWLLMHTGSPIYPFNYLGLPHSAELARLNSVPAIFTPWAYFEGLFVGGYGSWLRHRNFGLGFAPAIVLGFWALWHLWRSNSRILIPLVVIGGVSIIGLAMSMTGTGWNGARYVSIGVMLFCLTGGVFGRTGVFLACLTVGLNAIYLLPINIGPSEYAMLAVGGITLLPVLLVVAIFAKFRTGRRVETAFVALVCWFLWTVFAADPIRSIFRYDVYRDAEVGLSFTNIPVVGNHALGGRSAAVWEAADQDNGQKIAVTVGWDGKGHNWFVYPLFGARLQNTLVYVDPSVTPVPLYGQRKLSDLSEKAWLDGLRSAKADAVVTMAPLTAEAKWITNHPDKFDLIAVGSDQRNFMVGLRPW